VSNRTRPGCTAFRSLRALFAVNEEAVVFINNRALPAAVLPNGLRLLHSKQPIEYLSETSWERRTTKLSDFVAGDGWLWGTGLPGSLVHTRLLLWMKTPKPENLVRYYKYWESRHLQRHNQNGANAQSPMARHPGTGR
jgi:hypothetical protein